MNKDVLLARLKDISPYILWSPTLVSEMQVYMQASLIVLYIVSGKAVSKPLSCTIQLEDLDTKYPQGWWEGQALETVALTICKACAVELISLLVVDKEPNF